MLEEDAREPTYPAKKPRDGTSITAHRAFTLLAQYWSALA
jgi:hypothetical protein